MARAELTQENLSEYTSLTESGLKGGSIEWLESTASSEEQVLFAGFTIQSQSPGPESVVPSEIRTHRGTSRRLIATASVTSEVLNLLNRSGPGDGGFREEILASRGIQILDDRGTRSASPTVHFGMDECKALRQELGFDSRVCIDIADEVIEGIQAEYKQMSNQDMVRSEFVQYAMESLFLRDKRQKPLPEETIIKVERMLGMGLKPEVGPRSDYWKHLPVVQPSCLLTKEYDFDIHADVIYWLSLTCFHYDYRAAIAEFVPVHNDVRFCPYLTVDFRRDGDPLTKSSEQVATIAALALYNRCLLKAQRLKKTSKAWTYKHTCNLRHYAIILYDSQYVVWCVYLKGEPGELICTHDWKWPGCMVRRVARGDLRLRDGVRRLAEWINEIHRFGLGRHLNMIKKDLQILIGCDKDIVRPSLGGEGAEDSDTEPDNCDYQSPMIPAFVY